MSFDLNTIISAAIASAVDHAVEQATRPLLDRIAALESRPQQGLEADDDRISWYSIDARIKGLVDAKVEQAMELHEERCAHLTEDDVDERVMEADFEDKINDMLDYDAIAEKVQEDLDIRDAIIEVLKDTQLVLPS